MIKIGSLFSGIGGFELGLENAFPNSETVWHIEKDKFCIEILKNHWPRSTIYQDIVNVNIKNLKKVDVICGGFPCQDISVAGKGEGLNGEKSNLWWYMHSIINELQPRIAIIENVPTIRTRGLSSVLKSLAKIGYDAEWTVISPRMFGNAPHIRRRWFCVAYPNSERLKKYSINTKPMEQKMEFKYRDSEKVGLYKTNHWKKGTTQSELCSVDDGIPRRVAKLKALGNSIVPQCSEYIGLKILESGLLNDLI